MGKSTISMAIFNSHSLFSHPRFHPKRRSPKLTTKAAKQLPKHLRALNDCNSRVLMEKESKNKILRFGKNCAKDVDNGVLWEVSFVSLTWFVDHGPTRLVRCGHMWFNTIHVFGIDHMNIYEFTWAIPLQIYLNMFKSWCGILVNCAGSRCWNPFVDASWWSAWWTGSLHWWSHRRRGRRRTGCCVPRRCRIEGRTWVLSAGLNGV